MTSSTDINPNTLTFDFHIATDIINKNSIKIGDDIEYDSKSDVITIKSDGGCCQYKLQKIKKSLPVHYDRASAGVGSTYIHQAKIVNIGAEITVNIKKDGGINSMKLKKVTMQLEIIPVMNNSANDNKNVAESSENSFFVYGILRDDDNSNSEWKSVFLSGCLTSNGKLNGYKMYEDKLTDFPFLLKTDDKNDIIFGTILTCKNNTTFKEKLTDSDQMYGYGFYDNIERASVFVDNIDSNNKVKAILYYQKTAKDIKSCRNIESGDWLNQDDEKIEKYVVSKALVLIICVSKYDNNKSYDNLEGTKIDRRNMIKLFDKRYGYEVISNENDRIDRDDCIDLLSKCRGELTKKANKNKYQALFVIFSCHGNDQYLVFSDSKMMCRDKIYEWFNGSNVPFMSNKPKIIVMDACRGKNLPIPVPNNNKKPKKLKGNDDEAHHPDEQMILLYSTTKGYAVPDDDEFGGNVIRTIYNVFCADDYIDKYHLDDLF
eukprot:128887_1